MFTVPTSEIFSAKGLDGGRPYGENVKEGQVDSNGLNSVASPQSERLSNVVNV